MKKYQILEVREKEQHAGSKAIDDASNIVSGLGYNVIKIKCRNGNNNSVKEKLLRFITPFPWWITAIFKIENNSIVFLQHNGRTSQFGRSLFIKSLKWKKCKIVSLVHDVEPLRFGTWKGEYGCLELKQLKLYSDEIIVHNSRMKNYFVEHGFDVKKLVELEIFDYLAEINSIQVKTNFTDVVIAGNLLHEKSPYIYELPQTKKIKFGLYGPNFDGEEKSNVEYFGSFPSETLPEILNGKYGLVWDGNSIKTCAGVTGNYLRYNNPHKISLYIVSKIPIVIWEDAAMASFIKEKNIGITVKSIDEIEEAISQVSDSEYKLMQSNIEIESQKLETGFYLKTAITECEKRI